LFRIDISVSQSLESGSHKIPLDVRDASTIVLWVDDKLSGENKHFQAELAKMFTKLKIITMTSTKELIVWLNNYGEDTIHKIRIIR
jgi:hypothetical protein